jgi:photosystem II stability/assembly factor-like uncharacterized protein
MRLLAALLLALPLASHAQFQILDAKTTASLRGIDAISPQIAWASGSSGTVLLTTNGGATWKHCVTPAGAEKLDFRGVQGYDAMTAVIMASGKGPASAIYKTSDGCATWKLVFADPDADGFFDALFKLSVPPVLFLMGDPVHNDFRVFYSYDRGMTWHPDDAPGLEAVKGAGGFAASNSGFIAPIQSKHGGILAFATSATDTAPPSVFRYRKQAWTAVTVPMPANGPSSGIFSLASLGTSIVAVGGNYSKPTESAGTAAYSVDYGEHWQLSTTMPSGYRSAVAFDEARKTWIAVGPSGTDISKDHGKSWTPLKPSATDVPDADKNWNAISLPFVVGGRGKIGKLIAKF